jgi:hypothetical protein
VAFSYRAKDRAVVLTFLFVLFFGVFVAMAAIWLCCLFALLAVRLSFALVAAILALALRES